MGDEFMEEGKGAAWLAGGLEEGVRNACTLGWGWEGMGEREVE